MRRRAVHGIGCLPNGSPRAFLGSWSAGTARESQQPFFARRGRRDASSRFTGQSRPEWMPGSLVRPALQSSCQPACHPGRGFGMETDIVLAGSVQDHAGPCPPCQPPVRGGRGNRLSVPIVPPHSATDLDRFSDRLTLPPVMYLTTPIRWLIDLDSEGQLVNFISMPGEGRNARGIPRLAPYVGRTGDVKPKLLADTAEYVLGIARNPDKQERVDRCHAAFIELTRDCAVVTGERAVQAVLRFLETFERSGWLPPEGFDPGDILTFRVAGTETWPINLPSERAYSARVAGGEATEDAATERLACLVCREVRPPAGNIPIKIKSIPGGQTSGMALVSTNAVAFESYGLNDISGVPICRDCGERFSKAANELLACEDTSIRIGPLVYIFWTREEVGFRPGRWLSRPTPEDVRAVFASARSADPSAAESLDSNKFYAAALSASGARVVVRDWLETTIPNAQRHLARYFALQELVQVDGSESAALSLRAGRFHSARCQEGPARQCPLHHSARRSVRWVAAGLAAVSGRQRQPSGTEGYPAPRCPHQDGAAVPGRAHIPVHQGAPHDRTRPDRPHPG